MQQPGGQDVQSLNDIQDYLASFNKEIQVQSDTGQPVPVTISEVGQGDFPTKNGTAEPIPVTMATHHNTITTSAGLLTNPVSVAQTSAMVDNVVVQPIAQQAQQQGMQLPHVAQNEAMMADEFSVVTSGADNGQVMSQTQIMSQQHETLVLAQDQQHETEQKYLQQIQQDQTVYMQAEHDQPLVIAQPDMMYTTQSDPNVHVQLMHGNITQQQTVTRSDLQTQGHIQDTQLVAVQNVHDSSQPQLVAIQGQMNDQIQQQQNSLELLANASQQNQPLHQQQQMQDLIPTQDGNVVIDSNTGGASGAGGHYQTVTIVPSDVNQGGEVSYVLIVSNTDQEKQEVDDDVDLSVYDFKEDHRADVIINEQGEEVESEPQKRIIKLMPKKIPTTSQLMCNYCNYTSSKKYLLTRHMKTHSEERPHKCNICDRGFKTIASLQNHVNTHTGTKPHHCKSCDASFTTSGELVRHVRYKHTHEKPHRCTECEYTSVELSKLKRHMRSHTGERPYACPHCSYASPDTYKLKRHLRIHTGEKPYECDICHARFTQSNSLKAHRLIHSGDKPMYQCELCPTTCGRKTDLKIHIQKLHTSDKPLQCRKCAKSFPDRYTYKIHMKTHEGEKCYKCELCPYAALSERHLQSHILTHTGEKPFECVHCDQTFRQKQLLRRHLNLYHTPDYCPPPPRPKSHECSECDKCFAHKGNLLRHMALHDPESPMYQQLPPKTGNRIPADEEEDYDDGEDEIMDEDPTAGTDGQQNKTVMIEVTQEGSSQQMFLLMEVPADGEVDPRSLQLSAEQMAGMAGPSQANVDQQGVVPEGVEEAPDPSLMADEMDEEEGPPVLEPQVESLMESTEPVSVQPAKTPRRGTKRQASTADVKVEPETQTTIVTRRAQSPRTARLPVRSSSRSNQATPTKDDGTEEPGAKRARRETPKKNEEENRRKEEQIRKDIEECFGFDMDDDK